MTDPSKRRVKVKYTQFFFKGQCCELSYDRKPYRILHMSHQYQFHRKIWCHVSNVIKTSVKSHWVANYYNLMIQSLDWNYFWLNLIYVEDISLMSSIYKSDNLQYNTLGRWVDGTMEPTALFYFKSIKIILAPLSDFIS